MSKYVSDVIFLVRIASLILNFQELGFWIFLLKVTMDNELFRITDTLFNGKFSFSRIYQIYQLQPLEIVVFVQKRR